MKSSTTCCVWAMLSTATSLLLVSSVSASLDAVAETSSSSSLLRKEEDVVVERENNYKPKRLEMIRGGQAAKEKKRIDQDTTEKPPRPTQKQQALENKNKNEMTKTNPDTRTEQAKSSSTRNYVMRRELQIFSNRNQFQSNTYFPPSRQGTNDIFGGSNVRQSIPRAGGGQTTAITTSNSLWRPVPQVGGGQLSTFSGQATSNVRQRVPQAAGDSGGGGQPAATTATSRSSRSRSTFGNRRRPPSRPGGYTTYYRRRHSRPGGYESLNRPFVQGGGIFEHRNSNINNNGGSGVVVEPPTPSPVRPPSQNLAPSPSSPTRRPQNNATPSSPTRSPQNNATPSPTTTDAASPTVAPADDSSPTGAPAVSNSAFDIELMNVGSVTMWDDVFEEAARKWESIIVGDLPDKIAVVGGLTDLFQGTFPGVNVSQAVDDILIGYDFVDNLAENTYGQGGPSLLRSESPGLPYSGTIKFNSNLKDRSTDDKAFRDELFWATFHEMGHALGFGAMWISGPFLCGGKACQDQGGSGAYGCTNAKEQFSQLVPGKTLILDDECGHWNQALYDGLAWYDIMVPAADSSREAIASAITVGAMQDLGYEVNYGAADSVPSSRRTRESEGSLLRWLW